MSETREERIARFEGYLDEANAAIDALEKALGEYRRVRPKINALKEYYAGEWLKDFEADEAGLLPQGLKRGVLSQDGVFDLLARDMAVREEMGE